jgi:hypothetical protein
VNPSRLRQKVGRLDERRGKLLRRVLRPGPMISGSLYQMKRRCGNPRCKCTRGHLHTSWYLSRRHGGRTKLTYIGRIVPDWLATGVGRYGRYQKTLAAIRKIDSEISGYLNELRDDKVETFEQVHKERQ